MPTTRKTRAARLGVIAAAGCVAALSGGCARTTVWAWTPQAGLEGYPAEPSPASVGPADEAQNGRVSQGVLVFPRSALVPDDSLESRRRDGVIAARSPEAQPDRLGWAQQPRPDLSRSRTLRTSTQAERWTYPDTRRDHRSRYDPVYRSRGGW